MLKNRFFKNLQSLKYHKVYIFYALLYGISTLILPLTTQYIVNNLALSHILINTFTFLIILTLFLILDRYFKYGQIVLIEYLQREIMVQETKKWFQLKTNKSIYFLEITNLMKSFSNAFTNIIEIILTSLFGLLVVISFHPAFIFLAILIIITGLSVFHSWDEAVATSLDESNQKYELEKIIRSNQNLHDENIENFLDSRDKHYYFIKRNKMIVSGCYVLGQIFLLGVGIWLVQIHQLSLGQLVSAEIILSGIMAVLTKLPKTMESLYDYETSKIKLESVTEGYEDANK